MSSTGPSTTTVTGQIIDRHDCYLSINYGRFPIVMTSGKGCVLHDADGKEYLDLFAGFGASLLGHCHDDLVDAVAEQANRLWHVGNLLHTEPQTHLAEAIARHGFDGRSFFCHSGADANEAAIKLARLYGQGKRHKVISAHNSFHGRSFATMQATGQLKVREGFDPLPEGFVHVDYNDPAALEAAVDEKTVAILLEPIQGEGGVIVPDDDYLPAVRRLCDQRDLLLICDEVWTGCGRTGRWFAHQHWDVAPDIMTLAKGVGGGLPVGVMCATEKVAQWYDCRKQGAVKHASTLGGNCLAMAVGAAIFRVIEREGLIEHAETLGHRATERLRGLAEESAAVKQVRGNGLFIGVEIDPHAPGTWFENAGQIVDRALAEGLLINAAQPNVIRIAPPLVISQEELDQGLELMEQVILG